MNKAELIGIIVEKTQVNKKQAEEMINAFTETVMSTLKASGEVTIAGFGTFSARKRHARMGVNPQNPTERIQIPEVIVPKFKAGKGLKDSLKS
ncbi:MAG: HU family DNA-binding protein [Patescibacteria group bacterium]